MTAQHPDLVWAESGAMALTGHADGPPLLAPAPFAAHARAALDAVRAAAHAARLRAAALEAIDGAMLLGERAACAGLGRRGRTSAGGACKLVRCRDGWIAVSLAREDDVACVPAWLEGSIEGDPFDAIESAVLRRNVEPLVARARELGLPVAPVADAPPSAALPFRVETQGAPSQRAAGSVPLVVDLSSLWAGPLAAQLLSASGARVIKVESTHRPDGARKGPAAFYDALNAGKHSVALDFTATEDRRLLHTLVERADLVVESSRPRALAQLGIDAATLVRRLRGFVWVSITAYGRTQPMGSWVGFGDDVSAAAGAVAAMSALHGTPLFCADAIADPLAGMHAAHAALEAWRTGRSALLDVSLCAVTQGVLAQPSQAGTALVRRATCSGGGKNGWEVVAGVETRTVSPPRARTVHTAARPLGADTRSVLAELSIAC